MRRLVFHKLRWRWLFTLIALVILFVVGVLVSWMVSSDQLYSYQLDSRVWLMWRILCYVSLVGLWPLLIQCVLRKSRVEVVWVPTRFPIIMLIILYELLIVQNPLKTLLSFWSAR